MAESNEHNDAYSIRVHMTFSERANPALVAMLRGLAPRAQSRLIRTLVERGLTVNLVPPPTAAGATPPLQTLAAPFAPDKSESQAAMPASPLDFLGSRDALDSALEMSK